MKRASGRLALLGLLLVLAGSWLAARIQTTGGITVSDLRFAGGQGVTMRGLLYVPATATTDRPAPGILAVHGYINSAETQSGFAIEYARRGYVVLAMDQTGHGYSGGAAFSQGFGGPAGLAYLRSLAVVDPKNIGLEGHSMGGWTVLAAAAALPDGYKSMVLEGSSTGKPFAGDGTPTWPRNLALVFSRYDEFSRIMWDVDRAQDVGSSPKLQRLFGSSATIVPGEVYGSIGNGTARRLTMPETTHPGDHTSPAAIGDSIDWFAQTLDGGTPLPMRDQIWHWKEIGTGIGFAGIVLLMLGVFNLLAGPAGMRRTPVPAAGARDARWWRAFATSASVPVALFFPVFIAVTVAMPPSRWLPQVVSTQVTLWALAGAAVSLVIARFSRPAERAAAQSLVMAAAVAVVTVGAAAAMVFAIGRLFLVDARFWVVALKWPSAAQAEIMLIYLIPLTLTYLVTLRGLTGRLTVAGDSRLAQYGWGVAALASGFAVFLLVDYAVFFLTGSLPTAIDPLTTVIAIQFVPLLAIVAIIGIFTWRRTASHVPGALICGLFVTWYVVAGTATQVV